MSSNVFRLDAYLERIGYESPLASSVDTFCQLHRAQALHIPFENLDIHLGKPIRLDPASLMTKLIDQKRGGYCYELNGLFFLVLQHLGFTITNLGGRVMHNDRPTQKSHQFMMVTIAGKRWLADLGFGGNGLVDPLPFEVDVEFRQSLDTFRLKTDPVYGFFLQHKLMDDWRTLYAFTLEEYYPVDYRMMNYFNSNSPDSIFTQKRICTIPRTDARIILNDFELKIRQGTETTTTQLEDEEAYRKTLERYFGIILRVLVI